MCTILLLLLLCMCFSLIQLYTMIPHVQKDKLPKKTQKKSTGGADKQEDAHGILEGISSLHSWIKTQTMIRPHQRKGGKPGQVYDEVSCKKVDVFSVKKIVFLVHTV